MAVAKLAKWSLTIPEIRDLNPVLGNFYWNNYQLIVIKRKKETGNGHFLI